MKIIVCSKQIRQDNRIKPDRSGLEAALRLKKKTGAAVAFLCLGDASAITQIREAMAMGCDEGTLLSYPGAADIGRSRLFLDSGRISQKLQL